MPPVGRRPHTPACHSEHVQATGLQTLLATLAPTFTCTNGAATTNRQHSFPLLPPPAPPACSVAFAQARDAEYEAAQRILREEGLKVPVDLEFDFDR